MTCPPVRSPTTSPPSTPAARSRSSTACGSMGRILTAIVRDGSWFAFNWFPAMFSLQYLLATKFAPTRWLSFALHVPAGGAAAAARDPPPRPRRRRLDLSGDHGRARRAAPAPHARRPGRLRDHRPRGPPLLGPPRRRPPHDHASRVDRGGRGRSPAPGARAGRARPPIRRSCEPRSRVDAREALGLPQDDARSSSSPAAAGASATSSARSRRRSPSRAPRSSA